MDWLWVLATLRVGWAQATLAFLVVVLWVVVALPKRTGAHAWPGWEAAFAPQAPVLRHYEAEKTVLADELFGLSVTLRLAHAKASEGELAEAARVARLAAEHAVRHVPSLRARIDLLARTARALSALDSLPRLRVFGFRLWRLRGAVAGESALRPVLDAAHRCTLRVWLLLFGLGVLVRSFSGTAQAITPERAEVQRALRRLGDLEHDLGALHGASLEVYRTVLISGHARHG